MTSWFRSWHGAPTDPKWLAIARRAGVAPGVVVAVVWALMDHASQAGDRGSVAGFDAEAFAVFSGFDEDKISRVIEALSDKGIISNERLAAWDKRQPKREDNSAARVKRYREKQREDNDAKRDVTQCNAPEADTETETDTASAVARERAPAAPDHQVDFEKKQHEYAAAVSPITTDPRAAFDISPLTALEAKGYDWERDILAAIKDRVASGKVPKGLRSASYFVPMIQDRHAIPAKPQAPPKKRTTWVTDDDSRWPQLVADYEREHGKKPTALPGKNEFGKGFRFDDDMIAGVTPEFLKRTA